ncbi:MAG: hypothetical protein LBC41_01800, partial [Clostridiales bacterium]|nr:hypothetical protein [Clostridiales bacterium]
SYINTSPAATFTCVGGPPTVTLDFEVIVIDLLDPSSEKLLNKSPILKGFAELTRTIYDRLDHYANDAQKVAIAVHEAFETCIANGNPLRNYLISKRKDWESMAVDELSLEEYIQSYQEAADKRVVAVRQEADKRVVAIWQEAAAEREKSEIRAAKSVARRLKRGDDLEAIAIDMFYDVKELEELLKMYPDPDSSPTV